jgi:hypothetical protein
LEDAVIPLGESVVTLEGERINQIAVRKGQVLTLGIASYQRFSYYASMNYVVDVPI